MHTNVFTYMYDGANHMVRAESVTTTAVYTYNADGLRVQDARRRYVWDWAAVAEFVLVAVEVLLHAGQTMYLVGIHQIGGTYL